MGIWMISTVTLVNPKVFCSHKWEQDYMLNN